MNISAKKNKLPYQPPTMMVLRCEAIMEGDGNVHPSDPADNSGNTGAPDPEAKSFDFSSSMWDENTETEPQSEDLWQE